MTEIISKLYTIGVYDSTEDSFFETLTATGITVFCDVRARRGLRGKVYAYANSQYLQEKLKQLGIHYIHFKELAPSKETRNLQDEYDQHHRISRRQRTTLGHLYIRAYEQEILENFDSMQFLKTFKTDDKVVLFCVEHHPEACHRSLLANRIAEDTGIIIVHLIP